MKKDFDFFFTDRGREEENDTHTQKVFFCMYVLVMFKNRLRMIPYKKRKKKKTTEQDF